MSKRRSTERGSASIYVLLMGVLVLAAGVVVSSVAAVVTARHRAESIADLAALAAAEAQVAEPTASCATASSLTEHHGAVLLACVPADDGSVRVDVGVPVRLGRLLTGTTDVMMARGRARAG